MTVYTPAVLHTADKSTVADREVAPDDHERVDFPLFAILKTKSLFSQVFGKQALHGETGTIDVPL